MGFHIIRYHQFTQIDPDACELDTEIGESDDGLVWSAGWRWGTRAPRRFVFGMGPIHPGRKLVDLLPNTMKALVVNAKVRSVLQSTGVEIEYLPVEIRDHRNRPVKGCEYWIANVIGWYDCIDRQRTVGKRLGGTVPGPVATSMLGWEVADGVWPAIEYGRVDVLELDPSRTPQDKALFRLKAPRGTFIVTDSLISAFTKAGITGLATHPIGMKIPLGL